MFIGKWLTTTFVNFAHIWRCFNVSSGFKVNFHKSKVYGIGVLDDDISRCARIMGCEASSFPFIYLGVPLGANMSVKRNWKSVVEKIHNKLSSWKVKTLSFGGKFILIKSVLNSLPLYFFSIPLRPHDLSLIALRSYVEDFYGVTMRISASYIGWRRRL